MWKWTGSGKWAVGASRWKKNARSNGQDRSATAPAAHSGEYSHGRPIAPQTAVLTPREPQEDRPPTPPPRGSVRAHRQTASAFLPTGQSGDQRRRQEEGTGGELQECWRQVGSHSYPCQRPRLSLAGRGRGHSVWHLRPPGQSRRVVRWRLSRNFRLRRILHPRLVASRRARALSEFQTPAHPSRHGREQLGPAWRLERPTSATL